MSHLDIITAVIFSRFCIIAHLSLPDVYKVSVDHLSYYLPRAWAPNSGLIMSGLVNSFFSSTLEDKSTLKEWLLNLRN